MKFPHRQLIACFILLSFISCDKPSSSSENSTKSSNEVTGSSANQDNPSKQKETLVTSKSQVLQKNEVWLHDQKKILPIRTQSLKMMNLLAA